MILEGTVFLMLYLQPVDARDPNELAKFAAVGRYESMNACLREKYTLETFDRKDTQIGKKKGIPVMPPLELSCVSAMAKRGADVLQYPPKPLTWFPLSTDPVCVPQPDFD